VPVVSRQQPSKLQRLPAQPKTSRFSSKLLKEKFVRHGFFTFRK
jgi:hypothetical protein